jgi:DNA-binding NarL/FixJ family response regulator
VVIMDLSMPKMDGIEATRRIKREAPSVRVIGLSMYDEEEFDEQMRRAGAEAYLSKAGPSEVLFATVRGDRPPGGA